MQFQLGSPSTSIESSPSQSPLQAMEKEAAVLPSVPASRAATAEERKARQRIHVRRSYYRKLNNIQSMREEVSRLEEEYTQLKTKKEAAARRPIEQVDEKDESMMGMYKKLTALKISLREQNVAMKETVKEYERFHERLQHIASSDADQIDDGRCPPSVKPPSDFPETEPFDLVPLTLADCQQIASQSYREICQFMESHAYVTTGAPIFGWRDRRLPVGDDIKFTLRKDFAGRDHEALWEKAWRLMSTPKGLASLYSSAITQSIKALQVVNDDNVVLYRVIFSADRRYVVKALVLITRFSIGDRFVILFRTLDRDRFVVPKPIVNDTSSLAQTETALDRLARKEGWMEMFTWTMYDPYGQKGEDCKFNFGGVVHSTAATSTRTWMMEILFLALRFENKIIGPLVALEQ